jgi:hypothetical protein
MSNVTANPLAHLSILTDSHMTAMFETRSGSHYTVVARPSIGVVLVCDNNPGWVFEGSRLEIRDGAVYLLHRNGRTIAHTTQVVRVNILTN